MFFPYSFVENTIYITGKKLSGEKSMYEYNCYNVNISKLIKNDYLFKPILFFITSRYNNGALFVRKPLVPLCRLIQNYFHYFFIPRRTPSGRAKPKFRILIDLISSEISHIKNLI